MSPITPEWLEKIADEVEKDPTRWTQGAWARDSNGAPCMFNNAQATCWCIRGFAFRDLVNLDDSFLSFWASVGTNDSLNSPAEFVSWLREMAKELEVQS